MTGGGVELRATFDQDAERYTRHRPSYPPQLFDDLAGMVAGDRVLEIGCGTGQATLPLAQRGFHITAVELGDNLAAAARQRLAGFETVHIVQSAFEGWPLPAEGFDLVLAATSFHWIDPAVRMVKTADALRPGGALAVISTRHVAGGTEDFFVDMQRCYLRFVPSTMPGFRLPASDDVPGEFDESDRYESPEFFRYHHELTYTAEQYTGLLATYSNHIALPAEASAGLYRCITRLIDQDYGGQITMRYLFQLALARVS